MERKVYSREFKLEAVRLVREQGLSSVKAASDLGISKHTLRSWLHDHDQDPQEAFPGHGVMKPEEAEIARLRREVARLKAERDILKKAAAYFAKESL